MKSRALCLSNTNFPGPVVEAVGNGNWSLPDPPVFKALDRFRILVTWKSARGLDPIDSELLFRIMELNSENV